MVEFWFCAVAVIANNNDSTKESSSVLLMCIPVKVCKQKIAWFCVVAKIQ
jgi:hypothetical protein